MEFRILGPVEVITDGRVVALGQVKQRALLALLLLHVNEVVSRDRLIEDLWGERAPQTAATSLHTYVSQLRKLLEGGNGSERMLLTRAPGYLLALDPDQVDVTRFERLAREGKQQLAANDPQAAGATLAEALALWRGPPLTEFGSAPFALAENLRLQELRVSTLEDRIEADLALARHQELIAELETLARDHPFRERLHAQLMLAFYRSGRQAEALDVYRQTRRRLVDELGIEPGPALQQLEQAILRHEPTLAVEAPPDVAEPEQEHADRITPAASEPASPTGRHRARRWRRVAAAVTVLVAIALGVGYAVRGGTRATKLLAPNSVGFLDAKSGRITSSYPVGREPGALSVTDNAVWVANYRNQTVTHINRTTSRVDAIPVGGHPTGITFYKGAIWVWTLEGLLVPVDPHYSTAGDPIRLAPASAAGRPPGRIAASGGFLWITVPDASVLRVDPVHPERWHSILPDWGAEGPIVGRGDQVWVAGSSAAGYVFPIADRTGAAGSGVAVGGPIRGLAAYAGSLWVLSGTPALQLPRPKLRAVDLHDRLVRATVTVGKDPVALIAAAGSIWVASGTDQTISRVDPSRGRRLETIKLGANPTALAADRDGIWVAVR
jgi:DNA-binding SARP family transcriptional activator